jgi:adenylate cyclase
MSRLAKSAILGFSLGMVGYAVSFLYFTASLEEDIGLGLLFKLRGMRGAPSSVAVISIDQESSEHLNLPNNPDKWPRSLHARLVEKLVQSGAKVITFDLHFLEPRVPADDSQFAQAIGKAGNVILSEPLVAREISLNGNGLAEAGFHSIVKPVPPLEMFTQSAVATAPFVLPRIPFKVNQYWTFQSDAADSPTFPIAALQYFSAAVYVDFRRLLQEASPDQAKKLPATINAAIEPADLKTVMREIREIFENQPTVAATMLRQLETDGALSGDIQNKQLLRALIKMYSGGNRRYINYYGPPRTVTTIPYYQALQLTNNDSDTNNVKGKAIFVGLSEKMLAERKDSFYTVFSQANGVFISGVEIAATAFLNLLEDTPVKPVSTRDYILLVLVWGLIVGVICGMTPLLIATAGVLVLAGCYLFAADYRFGVDGLWCPIVIPLFFQAPLGLLAGGLWNYLEVNKERQNIRKALAYYVPNDVVNELAKNVIDMKRGGQTVYGACLFTDAAGYTTLSEGMEPQQLGEFMHEYFQVLFEPIKRHGGFVVDMAGDSILALWKDTQPDASLRLRVCLAALDISRAVERFNRSYENLDLPTRIGVHAGEILLGNIATGDHYRYGPTGDVVNTASRMDGLNKYLGTELLVSEEVLGGVDGLLTREVGAFKFKGKTKPVVVHQLLCRLEEADQQDKSLRESFADGLEAFRRGAWHQATETFQRVIEASPTDGPTRYYLRLCETYEKNPPGESWCGIVSLEEK